jgi:pimeloyl-ACP methyl ester carboxylesterase
VNGYVDFLAGLIRELGLDRPVLVGTSLGGHVAAALACRHPEKVRGLMLVGATGLFPLGDEARARLASRAKDRSLAGIESKAKAVFYDAAYASPAFIREEHRVNNSPGADEVFTILARYFIEQLDRDVVGPALAALSPRPPIELLWGSQDRSVPLAVGLEAAKLLAPAPLHVIEEAAHAPYYEKPEQFNGRLDAFLRSIP